MAVLKRDTYSGARPSRTVLMRVDTETGFFHTWFKVDTEARSFFQTC